MSVGIIFDLDQTLIDSSLAEQFRSQRDWKTVYTKVPDFIMYEGIMDSLLALEQRGVPFCIVTSSPSSYCRFVCNHWNIKSSHMVCYHDTSRRKPHPDPIQLGVKHLGISPSNVLSFGDRDIDIIASNAARVPSVACLWGATDTKRLIDANPSHVINAPVEIIPLIDAFITNLQIIE